MQSAKSGKAVRLMVDETFDEIEIPDWEPPIRMQCKNYELADGRDICKLGGDRRIINDEWCVGCAKYEPGTIEAPRPEHKETMMASGRVGKVDWNQPAKNLYDAPEGVTLRQYLKEGIEEGGSVVVYADALGVTPGALVQAIKRVPASVKPAGALVARNSGKCGDGNLTAKNANDAKTAGEGNGEGVGSAAECAEFFYGKGVKPENNIPADVTPEPEMKTRKAPVDVNGDIIWDGPAVDSFPGADDHNGDSLIEYLLRLHDEDRIPNIFYMGSLLGATEEELSEELWRAKQRLEKAAAGNGVPALQTAAAPDPQASPHAPREKSVFPDQFIPHDDIRDGEDAAVKKTLHLPLVPVPLEELTQQTSAGEDACATRDTAGPVAPREQQGHFGGGEIAVSLAVSLEAALAYIKLTEKTSEFFMFCTGWNMAKTGDPAKSE